MKTIKTKKPKKWINIRIHEAIYLRLKKLAKKKGEGLSEVIGNAI